MKSRLFFNQGFFAALYSLPKHGGLSVVLFSRWTWQFVDTYYLGSVFEAVNFLRGDSYESVKTPADCLPFNFHHHLLK